MPAIECNGVQLSSEDHGAGPALVLLHGAAAGLRYFEPRLTGLAADHRAVAYDRRGHGRSEKTERGHTMAQYARDLPAVLEQLALGEPVLVGWSMGALVT